MLRIFNKTGLLEKKDVLGQELCLLLLFLLLFLYFFFLSFVRWCLIKVKVNRRTFYIEYIRMHIMQLFTATTLLLSLPSLLLSSSWCSLSSSSSALWSFIGSDSGKRHQQQQQQYVIKLSSIIWTNVYAYVTENLLYTARGITLIDRQTCGSGW